MPGVRVAVLGLLVLGGCGESGEDRYAKALVVYKTEVELAEEMRDALKAAESELTSKQAEVAALLQMSAAIASAEQAAENRRKLTKAQSDFEKSQRDVIATLKARVAVQEKRVGVARAKKEAAEKGR